MLAVDGNQRQWCAVCSAVDGSLELRVGEPGSLWRPGERRRGESWLREHGFVHVVDAWAKPVARETSASDCVLVLDAALRDGLAAPADRRVVEVLVHPGVIQGADPPAPQAPHVDHIRSALIALAQRGRGKLSIEGGRPASSWAWAFVSDGALILSPETPVVDDEWTVSLARTDVERAAERLTHLLHNELSCDPHAPLFITCMAREPSDPPLL
jgi:hypothetical protein